MAGPREGVRAASRCGASGTAEAASRCPAAENAAEAASPPTGAADAAEAASRPPDAANADEAANRLAEPRAPSHPAPGEYQRVELMVNLREPQAEP